MSNFFDTILSSSITPLIFAACTGVSAVLGLLIALVYMATNKKRSAGFVTTLALLPAVVQIVIMLVNGNLGAGVAVAGAFSLVRFRSIPGTAREIGAIFVALAAGLATGMGYLAFAGLFVLVMALLSLIYAKCGFGDQKRGANKVLTVVIPEDLNYSEVFDDLFERYTLSHELVQVKTTNMGSLFKLRYELVLQDERQEKAFIDELRCRNGNLEIMLSRQAEDTVVL